MRWICLALSLALHGCAHTAVVHCWEPAEIDVAGMNRVMVVRFSGEHGPEVAADLSAKLWKNDFYEIVDRSELDPRIRQATFSESQSIDDLLSAASDANIDGVIVGSVIEYWCEDQFQDSAEASIHSEEAQDFTKKIQPQSTENRDQFSSREALVVISFRFIDVETGEVRAVKQVSQKFVERPNDAAQQNLTSDEILQQLTTACIDEIVETLAPHEGTCEIKFATSDVWTRGAHHVRNGLKLVQNGDWDGAEAEWLKAVETNPENHAAMFNLAIVAAKRQAYDEAEQYALEALKVEHSDCYIAGLEKIRQRRSACSRANDQREARVVNAYETIWQ